MKPAPENYEVGVHSVCGGGINEHVLCDCDSMEAEHYECVEEILQRMADDGDETGQAAIALIQRLREAANREIPCTCTHGVLRETCLVHGSKFASGADEPQFQVEGMPSFDGMLDE